MALAVYMLYKNVNTNKINITVERMEMKIYSDFKMGICEYDTINPILSKSKDVQYLSKLIYNSLITITKDFKIENDLAEEFSKIGPTSYLVKLKNDVTWHNGNKFTSKDVEFTINNLKKLQANSIYKQNVKDISNIEIIDEYTLKINLNKETPFFEYMLIFPILSKDSYNKELTHKDSLPVGTGEYRLGKISDGTIEIETRKMGLDLKINKIHVKIYDTPTKLYEAFKKEEVDLINIFNSEYEEYISTFGLNSNISQDRELDYLAINVQNSILSNTEVRQAINYIINKEKIIEEIYNSKYHVSSFPLDYGSYLYEEEEGIEEARKILTDNGWEYNNNSWIKNYRTLEFGLIVKQNDEKRILVSENIQKQLEEFGIKIRIIKVGDLVYENYLKNKNYDAIFINKTVPVFPELNTYFGEENLSNYNNEEVATILKEINIIQNEEVLSEKYKRIIEIYKKDIPFISLYFNSNILLFSSKLKGDMSHNWYNLFYNIPNWYRTN